MGDKWFEVHGLCKNFAGIRAILDFSCSLGQGEILGLIGPNGAGKTTFFNIVSGFIAPDRGQVLFKGVETTRIAPYRIANLGIRRTFQDLRLIRQITVLDNVMLSMPNQPGERLTKVFFRWSNSRKKDGENRSEAMALLAKAGLAEEANIAAGDLSYGQQKLLSLVCCLSAKAELLLLDEPIAGIAPEMIRKILKVISSLRERRMSVILIEHNFEAVMQICDRVIFMDLGTKVSEGTPERVRDDPKVIQAYTN